MHYNIFPVFHTPQEADYQFKYLFFVFYRSDLIQYKMLIAKVPTSWQLQTS